MLDDVPKAAFKTTQALCRSPHRARVRCCRGSTGNIIPTPPPGHAVSLSVLHQTSKEAIWCCPLELDHPGPVQADA